jgi:four helix bundle protein
VKREIHLLDGGVMEYLEWENTVPDFIKNDSLWKMSMYRAGLYISSLGWNDVTVLYRDRRTIGVAKQLSQALGSIHANLAEGYSRGSGRSRALYYEYALGSARESRSWYFDGRHILGREIFEHRGKLLTRIIQLGLAMIPQQRGKTLREENEMYLINYAIEPETELSSWAELKNVPIQRIDV